MSLNITDAKRWYAAAKGLVGRSVAILKVHDEEFTMKRFLWRSALAAFGVAALTVVDAEAGCWWNFGCQHGSECRDDCGDGEYSSLYRQGGYERFAVEKSAPVVRYVEQAPAVRYVERAPAIRYVERAPEIRYIERTAEQVADCGSPSNSEESAALSLLASPLVQRMFLRILDQRLQPHADQRPATCPPCQGCQYSGAAAANGDEALNSPGTLFAKEMAKEQKEQYEELIEENARLHTELKREIDKLVTEDELNRALEENNKKLLPAIEALIKANRK